MILPGVDTPATWEWVLVVIVVGIAAFAHGALGLGFPLLATPLLAVHMDVRNVMLVLLLPTIAINGVSVYKGRRWRTSIGTYWPLAVYAVAGSWLGTRLLVQTDPNQFKPLLAVMIWIYLLVQRHGLRIRWINRHPGAAMAVFGLTAGLFAGTVNVTAVPLIIFFLETKASARIMVQVFNFCFLCAKLTQGTVFAKAGLIDAPVVASTLPWVGVALLGLTAGMLLRSRIDARTYRAWLRKLLFVIAGLLMGQWTLHHWG